jgi:hypothetical protein
MAMSNAWRNERQFGFLFSGVSLIVAFWPLWPLTQPNGYWLAAAGVWLSVALAYPRALAPLYRWWMAFGHVLGWINTRLIMGLVFVAMVIPTALLLRLFGKDPMRMRQRAGSYWIRREGEFTSQSMKDQF